MLVSSTVGDRTPANFVSFETFEHDQDGNMTKRTLASNSEEVSYEWTDFASRRRYEVRLKHVESDTNGRMQDARYDVDGLRSRKLASAALPQVKNGNSSLEHGVGISTTTSHQGSSASAAPTISYVSGHMILGAEIDGTFVYHLGDALSSVRDVVDSAGNVIRSNEWDEYGNLISSSGSGAASPKTWVGGLSVNDDTADSKLYNMGHRNYAGGVLGRFISRDPIGHRGNLNLYAYPTNPVNAVDPAGLEPFGNRDSNGKIPILQPDFFARNGYGAGVDVVITLKSVNLGASEGKLDVGISGVCDKMFGVPNGGPALKTYVDALPFYPLGNFSKGGLPDFSIGDPFDTGSKRRDLPFAVTPLGETTVYQLHVSGDDLWRGTIQKHKGFFHYLELDLILNGKGASPSCPKPGPLRRVDNNGNSYTVRFRLNEDGSVDESYPPTEKQW